MKFLFFFFILLLQGCLGGGNNSLDVKSQKDLAISSNNAPYCTESELKRYLKKNETNVALERFISCQDQDGDLVTYYLKKSPRYGTLSDCLGMSVTAVTTYLEKHTDLTCLYSPHYNFEGTDEIIYTATDGQSDGETDITVKISIAENSAPVAYVGQIIQIDRGLGAQQMVPISPATDVDYGDQLSYALLTHPSKGTLTYCLGLNGTSYDDRSCIYTPTETGSDSFTYKVTDNSGAVSIGTVTLKDINSETPIPIASYSVYVKMNGGTQKFKTDSTLATNKELVTTTNIYGDLLIYSLSVLPAHGLISDCLGQVGSSEPTPDVTCEYTPTQNYKGSDSFAYKVTDPNGNYIEVAVQIEVVNNLPYGLSTTIALIEDGGAQNFNLTPFIGDLDGDLWKVVGVSPVNQSGVFDGVLSKGVLSQCLGLVGSLSLTDSDCVYTPNSNEKGEDSLTYTVYDLQNDSQTYTITFDILNSVDNPLWPAQSVTVRENGGKQSFTLVGAVAVDEDTGDFNYQILTLPATGTLENCLQIAGAASSDISCNYTPVANATGAVTFQTEVSDGVGGTTNSIITINILTTNQKPSFSGVINKTVSFTLLENGDGTAVPTLLNIPAATDPDPTDTLTYAITRSPQGTLSNCSAQMDCDYLPPVGVYGTIADYFDVTVYDNEQFSETLRVNINITQDNNPPSFGILSTTVQVSEYPGVFQDLSVALPSAIDIDPSDNLSYSVLTHPQRGSLANCLGLNGSSSTDLNCQYKIDPNLISLFDINNDYDQFTIQVFDGENGYDTTQIVIKVIPVNSPPLFISGLGNMTITKNTPIQFKVIVDEGGGIDENSQDLTLTITSDNSIVQNSGITLSFGSDKESAVLLAGDITTGISLGDGPADAKTKYLFVDMTSSYLGASQISSVLTFTLYDSHNPSASVQKVINLTANNKILYEHGGWTEVYVQGPTVLRDHSYQTGSNDSKVTLKWNNPVSSGSDVGNYSISGWNIYRSTSGPNNYDFDFSSPLNGSTLLAKKEYSDSDSIVQIDPNSNAGKVLWYRIRPYIGNGLTSGLSPTNDRTIRVVVPPRNKAFVHRWMANRYVCELNGRAIDRTHNYRCEYVGPGNTSSGGGNYFEVTKDFFIDRFGIGCPYTLDGCTFYNVGQPIHGQKTDCFTHEYGTAITSVDGETTNETIFYDRQTGFCSYFRNGAGSGTLGTADWEDFQSQYSGLGNMDPLTNTLLNKYSNYPQLPPLVNIEQEGANYYCNSSIANVDILYNTGGAYSSTTGHLMGRKEFFVASLWSKTKTDYEVMAIEGGEDLRVDGSNSRCNTNSGDGLDFTASGYNTETMPNEDNTSHSLLNGSTVTKGCVSRFGVQDMVGNTWEMSADRMGCVADNSCTAVLAGARLDTHPDMTDTFEAYGGVDYSFNGVIGPCDYNTDGVCDASESILMTATLNVDSLFYFIGLPVLSSYSDAVSDYRTLSSTTVPNVHNDESIVDAVTVNGGSNVGAILYGGSYQSGGDAAGIFSSYVDEATSQRRDASFRCINFIDN